MSYDAKRGASSAASGAMAGTMILPGWGTLIGGVGGLALDAFGQLTGDDTSPEEAYEQKLAKMNEAAGMYHNYRPLVQQQREVALRQQLSAYNGAAQAMSTMYGRQYDPRNYAPNLGNNPYKALADYGPAGPPGQPPAPPPGQPIDPTGALYGKTNPLHQDPELTQRSAQYGKVMPQDWQKVQQSAKYGKVMPQGGY